MTFGNIIMALALFRGTSAIAQELPSEEAALTTDLHRYGCLFTARYFITDVSPFRARMTFGH
jgi:hypothetical protein